MTDMTDEETFDAASGFAETVGGFIADVTGIEGAEVPVELAAKAGAAIGVGIEHLTDGAISDAASDGMLWAVGGEESLAAANAFDDGDILGGVGHMASGIGSHIADGAEELYDDAAGLAGDAVDAVGDALDYLNPF
jgi:hypothetical protein